VRRLLAIPVALALAAPAVARADQSGFSDWIGRTKLGLFLERTETTARFVIHTGRAWDGAPSAWKARLGRDTFCEDLRRDYPTLTSYTYYIKPVRTLAPDESIFEFPATYERTGSGTIADCEPAAYWPGR
jgi:hypothetical protein